MDDETLRLNISFVLREPSTSRAVQRAVRESRRFSRRRQKLARRFSSMSDAEFTSRVVMHTAMRESLVSLRVFPDIVTASIGLPELLPRSITLAGFDEPSIPEAAAHVVDGDANPEELREVTLFNAPATLDIPATIGPDSQVLVAGLVVRPGEQGLMLAGRIIETPSEASDPLQDTLAAPLEDLIRDFVDQWTPSRKLWGAPVEELVPASLNRFPSTGGT
jgi:hypothetical protein